MAKKKAKKGKIMECFKHERLEGNEAVMRHANLQIKRYYSLDFQSYRKGALSAKTKELLGLVASFVLRCDDCVKYHLMRCHEEGVTDAEMTEALNIGLIVGGTVTIPQLRRACKAWEELQGH